MLPASSPPNSGAISTCSELSDERRRELQERCSSYYLQMIARGISDELAYDCAEILAYKPLPWSISDQALVRRAWEQIMKGGQTDA